MTEAGTRGGGSGQEGSADRCGTRGLKASLKGAAHAAAGVSGSPAGDSRALVGATVGPHGLEIGGEGR